MGTILNVDISILRFIQDNICNPFLDKVMVFITTLGNKGLIWIAIGVMLLCMKKYRRYGCMVLLALAFCGLVGNLTIKPIVARIRPFETFPLTKSLLIAIPKDFSFPSGHTMSSFAAATVIFYTNKKWGIFALSLGALIAFSRLYLYVHYPSDVFVGFITGIVLAIISIKICNKYIKNDYEQIKPC